MLQRALLFACALLAALLVGCAGDASSDAETGVGPSSFQETVIAELKQADLEAAPGLDLALDEAFAEYEADPDRKDEIVAGLVDEAEQRLDTGIGEASLEEVSPDLMPLPQGAFDVRQYGFEPATTTVPRDLSAVYVVNSADALRRQIVREYGGPAVYAVPMDNVFVALPLELVERGDTEELFRTKAQRDFQTSDNPVSPELFAERDGELVLFT